MKLRAEIDLKNMVCANKAKISGLAKERPAVYKDIDLEK